MAATTARPAVPTVPGADPLAVHEARPGTRPVRTAVHETTAATLARTPAPPPGDGGLPLPRR